MPVSITCSCGRPLVVKDELAGRQIRCPTCEAVLTVPGPHDDVPTALPADEPPHSAIRTEAPAGPSRRPPLLRDESPRAGPPPRRPALRDHDDDLQKGRRRSRAGYHGNFWGGRTGSIVGGLLMMLIAVVWFLAGLLLGNTFFYYPPIMFVLGFVALIRGLAGHD
jgi:hypothetical protein